MPWPTAPSWASSGDIRARGLEREAEPQVYLPYRQVPDNSIIGYIPKDLVVRASVPPAALLPELRRIIAAADPALPITGVRMLGDVVEAETEPRAVQVRALAAFALTAFLLAAIGIHGLLSFTVTSRAPEIGVRLALGAQRSDILAMVLGNGARLAAIGIAVRCRWPRGSPARRCAACWQELTLPTRRPSAPRSGFAC